MTQIEITEKILDRFVQTNSRPNHVIDERWLNHNLMTKLNPKELELVTPSIEDLVNRGFIVVENKNGFCLILTQLGFDNIYPIKKEEVINKIQNMIISRFVQTNSRPNHVIDERWLNHNLMTKLNPKEQELVTSSIEDLVSRGFIVTENTTGFCLVLTQLGFDNIYK